MIKLVVKFFLIFIGIAVLVVWTVPKYKDTVQLKLEQARYNKALDDSKKLIEKKKELTTKFGEIDQITLMKIKKLLPDNVDNIRLVLEINQVAKKYGMVIKNIKYDTFNQKTETMVDKTLIENNDQALESDKDFGSFDLEFTSEGTYPNFVKFVEDLEKSLRIVDISNITFSSSEGDTNKGINPGKPNDVNQYDFKITTYWLKN